MKQVNLYIPIQRISMNIKRLMYSKDKMTQQEFRISNLWVVADTVQISLWWELYEKLKEKYWEYISLYELYKFLEKEKRFDE